MRLSDAIALGRTLQKGGSGWRFCDCALGIGMAAIGIPFTQRTSRKAAELWPWLETNPDMLSAHNPIHAVSAKYFDAAKGRITLDQLIDWVRSVEPPELEEVANGDRAETIAATQTELCLKENLR